MWDSGETERRFRAGRTGIRGFCRTDTLFMLPRSPLTLNESVLLNASRKSRSPTRSSLIRNPRIKSETGLAPSCRPYQQPRMVRRKE